jgi:hypothetical protein
MATQKDNKANKNIDKSNSQPLPQHAFGKFVLETEAKAHQVRQEELWEKIKKVETQRIQGGVEARERALERIYADMEALEFTKELMSLGREARLFQVKDLKSFVQLFEDDWKLAQANHQAQVKRARLRIIAPFEEVGVVSRFYYTLSIAFWSAYLVLQAGLTAPMRFLGWAFGVK